MKQWYRPEERSVRIAFVMASATLAGAFGGCIAYGVGHMNGTAGLEGFRWLFLIEGLISVLSCIPIILFLPDYPERSWLKGEDAKFATDRLEGLGYTKEHATRKQILETCFSPRMLAHYFAYVSAGRNQSILLLTLLDSGLRPTRISYFLHTHYCCRTRLQFYHSTTHDSPPLGRWLHRVINPFMVCRSLKRAGLSYWTVFHHRRHRLVTGRIVAC